MRSQNDNIFIIRCGETALKGMNKPYFERMLVERIRKLLRKFTGTSVRRSEGLIFVTAPSAIPENDIIHELKKVFGIDSISPAVSCHPDIDDISRCAVDFMNDLIKKDDIKSFKVEAKRVDKKFPLTSPEISKKVGAAVLKGCKVLSVDVHEPDVYLFVNVRDEICYIYQKKIQAFGGLPLGTNGKGLVLLSGGIDSPVASFMMAKRGMQIEAIHFHSFPYTSERARIKVEELASILAVYCSRFKMHIVNMLPLQEEIVKHCPEEETTIHLRRFMMRVAERIAKMNECDMLITGESLGQVASQTSDALVVTDSVANIPVMRPLIAMDKVDIIDIAKDIGTYEKSIEPYEDCCTVFLPRHPLTKPKLERIERSEASLDEESMIEKALSSLETIDIYPA